MNSNVSSQDAPAKTDWLQGYRQFDEPILLLFPRIGSLPDYQIWCRWMADAMTGEQILHEALRENTAKACSAYANSGRPPLCWPLSIISYLDQSLLGIQAKKFLLQTTDGLRLFLSHEEKSRAERRQV